MSEHLKIGVRFNDEDMVMLQAEVKAAAFEGRTEAYSHYAALGDWLQGLRGLPGALGSELRFDAGQGAGDSHIGVTLVRLDWSGHCACRVSLRSDRSTGFGDPGQDSMEVRLVVEPGALARFVQELERLVEQQGGEATLAGLAHG